MNGIYTKWTTISATTFRTILVAESCTICGRALRDNDHGLRSCSNGDGGRHDPTTSPRFSVYSVPFWRVV